MTMFPQVTGHNIDNKHFTLPREFPADYTVALMAFTEAQQYDVDSWFEFTLRLRSRHGVGVVELPTLQRFPFWQRKLIDYWMHTGIADPFKRANTITLYLDLIPMLKALDLPNTGSIYTLLVNREGSVYACIPGRYTQEKGQQLEAAILAVASKESRS